MALHLTRPPTPREEEWKEGMRRGNASLSPGPGRRLTVPLSPPAQGGAQHRGCRSCPGRRSQGGTREDNSSRLQRRGRDGDDNDDDDDGAPSFLDRKEGGETGELPTGTPPAQRGANRRRRAATTPAELAAMAAHRTWRHAPRKERGVPPRPCTPRHTVHAPPTPRPRRHATPTPRPPRVHTAGLGRGGSRVHMHAAPCTHSAPRVRARTRAPARARAWDCTHACQTGMRR